MHPSLPSPRLRVLLSLVFIIPGAIVLYLSGMAAFDASQSHSWPSTQGILRVGEGKYRKTVNYQFTVNGITHESDQVIHGEIGNRNRSAAWNQFSRLPNGHPVEVYYHPGNPGKSVLVRELDRGTTFNILWGCAFIFAGLFVVLISPRLLARGERLRREREEHA